MNGDLIHSKLATGEFPEEATIVARVTERLKK
jgi:hypothetical protein